MKKTILLMMMFITTIALAGQSGLAQYRYTQGNYSLVVADRMEFNSLGSDYDREVAFMEHRGGTDIATGQAGYDDYLYTTNYSKIAADDEYATRMSRGNMMDHNLITGQPGYDEYNYSKNYNNWLK